GQAWWVAPGRGARRRAPPWNRPGAAGPAHEPRPLAPIRAAPPGRPAIRVGGWTGPGRLPGPAQQGGLPLRYPGGQAGPGKPAARRSVGAAGGTPGAVAAE